MRLFLFKRFNKFAMKKCVFFLILFSLMPSPVYSSAYELLKKTGEYEVAISIDRNPPMLGDNKIGISLKAPDGKKITRAAVLVNYYMPPMPRMAPMNYVTPADLKGDTYRTTMHLIMEGPWIIALKITMNGKTTTVKFNINAR
jgi:hypothetical protein